MNRKYLQFNDLVFDDADMISSADLSGGFKTQTTEYSFGHGSYAPLSSPSQFSAQQTVSIELKFDRRKNRCATREQYRDFIAYNLSRPGRLWAIQGERLLWAWAYVQDFSETYAYERNFFSMDVDFVIYEGFWHKADKRKTFLRPHDSCQYLDDYDFRDADSCLDCCVECMTRTEVCPACMMDCEFLTKEDSVCGADKSALEAFYSGCGGGYKILYNCLAGKRVWGDAILGQRICKKDTCAGVIAGTLYSDTILDTDRVTITLYGVFSDPMITINGNSLQIRGEYDGILTIEPSGSVYFAASECCTPELLDLEKIEIPHGSGFGFIIHHGNNRVEIETNNCCGMACAYVYTDSITI